MEPNCVPSHLFLLPNKNTIVPPEGFPSCLKDLCQLSCESHTACPSQSEGISRFQIYPFALFWQWDLNAVSTTEHTEKVHSVGA